MHLREEPHLAFNLPTLWGGGEWCVFMHESLNVRTGTSNLGCFVWRLEKIECCERKRLQSTDEFELWILENMQEESCLFFRCWQIIIFMTIAWLAQKTGRIHWVCVSISHVKFTASNSYVHNYPKKIIDKY